jgi:hypothetical protein
MERKEGKSRLEGKVSDERLRAESKVRLGQKVGRMDGQGTKEQDERKTRTTHPAEFSTITAVASLLSLYALGIMPTMPVPKQYVTRLEQRRVERILAALIALLTSLRNKD